MQNIYYYLIEKPTIGGEFKARLDATVIGFTDTLCYNPSPQDPCNCSLSLEVTYLPRSMNHPGDCNQVALV
jgi:hypothetical protein